RPLRLGLPGQDSAARPVARTASSTAQGHTLAPAPAPRAVRMALGCNPTEAVPLRRAPRRACAQAGRKIRAYPKPADGRRMDGLTRPAGTLRQNLSRTMEPSTGAEMSSAREAILGAVRASLGREALDDAKRAALDARVPAHTIPAQDEDPVERFIRKFEGHAGTLSRIASRADVPAAVEAYRKTHDLRKKAAVGAALSDLQWPHDWEVHHDAAGIDETLSVTI